MHAYSDIDNGPMEPVAPRRAGLFEGISIAQVIAASAAAATSMLLASKIGIAGSVLGAAVSSMVTVICSQLYRNALDASAEKLRLRTLEANADDPYGVGQMESAADVQGGADEEPLQTGMRIAPTKLRAQAAAKRSANTRKIALVSGGIAVLAVIVCVVLVLAVTAGNGLGAKPQPIFTPAPAAPEVEAPSTDKTTDAPDVQPAPDTGKDTDDGSDTPETGDGTEDPADPNPENPGDTGSSEGTGEGTESTPATDAGTTDSTTASKPDAR